MLISKETAGLWIPIPTLPLVYRLLFKETSPSTNNSFFNVAFSSTESVPPRAVAPVPTVMVLPSATATFSFNVVAPSTTIAPVVFNEPVNFTLSALSISNLTFVFTSSVLV